MEFDTCHRGRDSIVAQLRLPFPKFYSSVPPGGLLMRRSPHPARGRVRRVAGAVAAVVLFAGGVTACGNDGPADTLKDFLTGWRNGTLDKVGFVTADGSRISADTVLDQLQSLSGDLTRAPLVLTARGEPKKTGDIATSSVKLDWTLPGGAPWSYESTVRLTQRGGKGWQIIWEPSIVNSELTTGDKLRLRRVASQRASILDNAGKPLIAPRTVVTVGVTPQGVKDLPGLTKELDTAFKKVG